MPFFKNLKNEICQVLEPEIEKVVEAGWKELTAKEEAAYRELLAKTPELTSSVSIEAKRVEAGLYDVLTGVEKKVEKAVGGKTTAKTAKPAQTAAKSASKGTKSNAAK